MCIRWLVNWSDSTKMNGATIRFTKYMFIKLRSFGSNHVTTVRYETRQVLCLWLSETAGRLGANYRARCSDVWSCHYLQFRLTNLPSCVCVCVCVCVSVCLSMPVFLDIGYGVCSTLRERRATLILRHVRDMGKCSHSSRPLVITMIAVIIITIIIIIIMKVSTISPLPWICPQTSSSDISSYMKTYLLGTHYEICNIA